MMPLYIVCVVAIVIVTLFLGTLLLMKPERIKVAWKAVGVSFEADKGAKGGQAEANAGDTEKSLASGKVEA